MSRIVFNTKQFYTPYQILSREQLEELKQKDLQYSSGEPVGLEGGEKIKEINLEVKQGFENEPELVPVYFIEHYPILTPQQIEELSGNIDRLEILGEIMDAYHNGNISDSHKELIESSPEVRHGLLDQRADIPNIIAELERKLEENNR